jgi:L-phenylalanine/L-methionine N-acetyltransferase
MSTSLPNGLRIRRAREGDAPAFCAMFSDPSVYGGTLQMPHPSEAHWRKRLSDSDQPGTRHIHLVAERDGLLVGSAGLHPVSDSPRRAHAMGLGITVAGPAQGQGVGKALMQALLHAADQWANVLRIELTVFADNARAIALYRSLGFVEEGRLRGYAFRDGRFDDVLSMARWRPGSSH